jgi:hypothetical protein
MPKTKLSKSKGEKVLEETKQRLRLQQEARTIARIEQLDIEACERLGRQLQLQHLELSDQAAEHIATQPNMNEHS